jgi:phospholipase C
MKTTIIWASPSPRWSKLNGNRGLELIHGIITALIILTASAAYAQGFQHVVIVVQEKRSTDNLFQ